MKVMTLLPGLSLINVCLHVSSFGNADPLSQVETYMDVSTASHRASINLVKFVKNVDGLSTSLSKTASSDGFQLYFAESIWGEFMKNLEIYEDQHLSATRAMISDMSNFLSIYSIDFNIFFDSFNIIYEDALNYSMKAKELAEMHIDLYSIHNRLVEKAVEFRSEIRRKISDLQMTRPKIGGGVFKRQRRLALVAGVAGIISIRFIYFKDYWMAAIPVVTGSAACAFVHLLTKKNHRKKQNSISIEPAADLRDLKNEENLLSEIIEPISEYIKQCSLSISEVAVHFRIIYEALKSISGYEKGSTEFANAVLNHFDEMQKPTKELSQQCQVFHGCIPLVEERFKHFRANNKIVLSKVII